MPGTSSTVGPGSRRATAARRQLLMTKVRERALWRLKDLHRDEFDALVVDELRRAEQ